MIVLEKLHQNLSEYAQSLLKKRFNIIIKGIIPREKLINSGSYMYICLLVLRSGLSIRCAILVIENPTLSLHQVTLSYITQLKTI